MPRNILRHETDYFGSPKDAGPGSAISSKGFPMKNGVIGWELQEEAF